MTVSHRESRAQSAGPGLLHRDPGLRRSALARPAPVCDGLGGTGQQPLPLDRAPVALGPDFPEGGRAVLRWHRHRPAQGRKRLVRRLDRHLQSGFHLPDDSVLNQAFRVCRNVWIDECRGRAQSGSVTRNPAIADRLAELAMVDTRLPARYRAIDEQPMPEAVTALLAQAPGVALGLWLSQPESGSEPAWTDIAEVLEHRADGQW